jgi:hypothetical protein
MSRGFMRLHLSLLIAAIALGASSGAIAASTPTSSGGGGGASGASGASSTAGGAAHGGGGGGGSHSVGLGGHGAFGGGFSNSGRFGSANLGRGSFSQAVGNHAADHAITMKTGLRTNSRVESDKKHPGNPEHHHHRFWRGGYATQLRDDFGSCAALRFDPEDDFVVGPDLLCGRAIKASAKPGTGRPAGSIFPDSP